MMASSAHTHTPRPLPPPLHVCAQAFTDVCRRFSPALHHFFVERFATPAAWLEAQVGLRLFMLC